MLVLLRLIFGGALFYGIVVTRQHAGTHPESGDVMGAFHLAICVVLAVANALVWAPYIGSRISEPLTGIVTKSTYVERKNYLLQLLKWVQARGWRRLTVVVAFFEGIHHPDRPTAFVIGLKHARPGSWLEKVYAREVFRFDNAHNCVLAYTALKRHGVDPGRHRNADVNLVLLSLERSVQPNPAKVPVPSAPSMPEPRRNRQIRLFENADNTNAQSPRDPRASRGPEIEANTDATSQSSTGVDSASVEAERDVPVESAPSPQDRHASSGLWRRLTGFFHGN